MSTPLTTHPRTRPRRHPPLAFALTLTLATTPACGSIGGSLGLISSAADAPQKAASYTVTTTPPNSKIYRATDDGAIPLGSAPLRASSPITQVDSGTGFYVGWTLGTAIDASLFGLSAWGVAKTEGAPRVLSGLAAVLMGLVLISDVGMAVGIDFPLGFPPNDAKPEQFYVATESGKWFLVKPSPVLMHKGELHLKLNDAQRTTPPRIIAPTRDLENDPAVDEDDDGSI